MSFVELSAYLEELTDVTKEECGDHIFKLLAEQVLLSEKLKKQSYFIIILFLILYASVCAGIFDVVSRGPQDFFFPDESAVKQSIIWYLINSCHLYFFKTR